MSTELAKSTGSFIQAFEGAKNQQSLKQYFDKDDTGQKLFTQVVVRAIQQDPTLLHADRTSLFLACQSAAQDGLLPDKRDGALVIYNTKVGNSWKKVVQWQPMIGGLRKKLALHGFIGLRAELVYANDVAEGRFNYEQGDEPKIVHKPNIFGDRGEIVGAYAVVKDTNTGEMYRDSMTVAELEVTRSKSKNPNAGAWKDYTNEMYRKTMARRLFKQLPLVGDIMDLINRDDDRSFDFDDTPKPSNMAQKVQAEVRAESPNVVDMPEPIEGEVMEQETKPVKKKAPRRKARTPEEIDEAAKEPAENEPDPLA